MQSTWKLRLLAALAMMGGALYLLWPTFVYFGLTEEQTVEVRKDSDAFKKYIPSWAPEKHIVPGLDLQGGISMILGIDLEKAISDKTGRTADRMRGTFKEKKVSTKEVRHLADEGRGDRVRVSFSTEKDKAVFDKDLFDYFQNLTVVDEDGLDVTFRLHPDLVKSIKNDAVDQTITTITKRIDKLGVTEPSIKKLGDDKVQVQLPGFDDPEEAKSLIGRTAQLAFMMCDDETTFLASLNDLPAGVSLRNSAYGKPNNTQGRDIYLSFEAAKLPTVKEYLRGKVPAGLVVKYGNLGRAADGEVQQLRTYTLTSKIELTGDDLVDAQVAQGGVEDPRPYAALTFSPAGGTRFEELTARSIGMRMAIVLEDTVDSAPVIQTKIGGGTASITMGGRNRTEAIRDAQQLTMVLKSGALPAPVTFREERKVGASLGADALARGSQAFMVGGFLIVAFMLIFYRLGGVVSVIGLVFNVAFVMATLSWLGGTVTLPGMAALLLTVGMAVDANIIINERIREELRAGKTARAAVHAGYDAAFSAIVDANVTTFIAGMVLWNFGSGPVQNFATTLLIGTVSSVVSAIFVTRVFFDMMTANNDKSTLSI